MKKNEATVLDFVSVRWYMYQPMLIYAVLNKELRNSVIFSAKRPLCSRFLKGHLLTDPEAFTSSSVMDCFLFNSTRFHCSFSGDLFTVSDAWIRILIFLTVSIVCHHVILLLYNVWLMGFICYYLYRHLGFTRWKYSYVGVWSCCRNHITSHIWIISKSD